ncbi:MAG: IS110 family transposase [Akkermansiaceae bacterium]|nr:IS110 family transposase [Pseudomonadales bacterium]NIP94925.1 IS110 family transposase [Akkermansiaceae bacterium]NIX08575.1 IS110 family transposase [Pseudomonadales bacterium]
MVVLGIDAHKRTHTIVAVDESGRQVGVLMVRANTDGHLRALRWAGAWEQRRWAVEDCRHVTRRLEADLLAAGEQIVRVPPMLMAAVRASVRTPGKSDPIDALATARAALRERDLPVARLDDPPREVRLLVDHRDQLVRERTRLQSRLRWHLHELDPDYQPTSLSRVNNLDRVTVWLQRRDGLVVDLCHELVVRIRQITIRADQLETEIARRVARLAPSLLTLPGCGPLTAGKLIGEIGDPSRFSSKDAFALFAGTAPVPASSGNREVFRLNRGGNRQVNAALHRIAVTQARYHPPAQAIIARHNTANGRKRHAYRVLKRRLANVVYRTLLADLQPAHTQPEIAA